jgi:hypothetical protein
MKDEQRKSSIFDGINFLNELEYRIGKQGKEPQRLLEAEK